MVSSEGRRGVGYTRRVCPSYRYIHLSTFTSGALGILTAGSSQRAIEYLEAALLPAELKG